MMLSMYTGPPGRLKADFHRPSPSLPRIVFSRMREEYKRTPENNESINNFPHIVRNHSPSPKKKVKSFSEIEAEFGSGGGQRRLGKYRSDDPAFQNEGPFGNSADNGMLG